MKLKSTLLVLFGGVSSEHDASCKSFEHINKKLTSEKISENFSEIKIGFINRAGKSSISNHIPGESISYYQKKPSSMSATELCQYMDKDNIFVYSILHGQHGEDGCIQGLAEFLSIRGSFGSVLGCSLAMSKYHCNRFVSGTFRGLKVPKTLAVSSLNGTKEISKLWKKGSKVVIKPSSLGASILTELFTVNKDNLARMEELISSILKFDQRVLVQEFIPGEEYSCGCIERNGKVEVLPLIKISTASGFFGHSEKHLSGKNSEDVVDPANESLIHKKIKRLSKKLFIDIGLQHVARFDFRVDSDEIFFLEINPLPGMMEGSLYPKMLRANGYGVEDVIVESFKNENSRQKKATTFRYHID